MGSASVFSRQLAVNWPPVHRLFAVCSPFIHSPFTVRFLSIRHLFDILSCLFAIRSLSVRCPIAACSGLVYHPFAVHLPSIGCPLAIRSLFVCRPYIARLPSVFHPFTVRYPLASFRCPFAVLSPVAVLSPSIGCPFIVCLLSNRQDWDLDIVLVSQTWDWDWNF